MITIRRMMFTDIPKITEWMIEPNQRGLYNLTEQQVVPHRRNMHATLTYAFESGVNFVAYDDDKLIGAAIGIVIPLVWCPTKKDLQMMLVQADNRITTAKLFKLWLEEAEKSDYDRILVDEAITTNFNYEKLGFRELRKTYYKEI